VSEPSPNDISVVDQHDAGERPAPVPTTGLLAGLDRVVEAVALALFVVMVLVVLVQVGARFAHVAVIWTEELARILLVVSAVLAMAVCVRRREHIVVDFFLGRMAPGFRRWLLAGFDLAILLFLAVWLRGAVRLAELNWGTIYVTVPWIAVSHLYLVEAVSIVLMMIFVAADLAARLKGWRAP
jgi:TRAP-type C4-dicarboxylate transport system permease small subunit